MKSPHRLSRRKFITRSTSVAAGAALIRIAPIPKVSAAEVSQEFQSAWDKCHDRVWPGPEYWANPQQDWRVAGGRLECVNAAGDRNIHLLTHQLGERPGDLRMSVKVGRIGGKLGDGQGSVAFRVGCIGALREYRNSVLYGKGLHAGLTSTGALFIGEPASGKAGAVDVNATEVELRLTAEPSGDAYKLTLAALTTNNKTLAQVTRENVPADQLVGNLVLVANIGVAQGAGGGGAGKAKGKAKAKAKDSSAHNPGMGQFWFADWRAGGSKVETRPGQVFGPILWSQYTLSGSVLKLSAQMPPMGEKESQTVRFQVKQNGNWTTLGEEKIHPQARTATFRITKWDDTKDAAFRLAYTQVFSKGANEESYWTGTIRRDPVDQPLLTVADVSCNIHTAFPNPSYVANMAKLNPDLVAFVGDQFYENTAGYGVQRAPLDKAILDYLRKWYVHGWTWRELMRDRPSLSLPDDHDVYQGNLWGEGGEGRKTTQEAGGYDLPAEWVNVVHRTQTSHHPDPHDPKPCKRGTMNYYGPMTYGRVSFAVLADRQYKSGPEGKVPPTGDRGDHVVNPNYDPRTADLPGLQLLGEEQMKFLREWVADWRGAEMKAVISQTIFTAMATTHGGQQEVLMADYDANGWPQTPRNEALKIIRKAFAVHLAGDQHLPALVHYGIDEHRDAGVGFAGPAVNVGYPRWWEPPKSKRNAKTGNSNLTGDFHDHFGHPLTVLAVKNGPYKPRNDDLLQQVNEKTSGLGLVRFDKAHRRITIECWPYLADVTKPGTQFEGWPVTIDVLDNYARKPAAHLPTLNVSGIEQPLVQVYDERTGELVYALRLSGNKFQPHVFAPGRYTVKVSEPETGRLKELTGLDATGDNKTTVEIKI